MNEKLVQVSLDGEVYETIENIEQFTIDIESYRYLTGKITIKYGVGYGHKGKIEDPLHDNYFNPIERNSLYLKACIKAYGLDISVLGKVVGIESGYDYLSGSLDREVCLQCVVNPKAR